MPTELVVEVSRDGQRFREVGHVRHEVPDDEDEIFRRDLWVTLDGSAVRFLRLTARNYGTVPAWHPGAGGESFVFVDEILIEDE